MFSVWILYCLLSSIVKSWIDWRFLTLGRYLLLCLTGLFLFSTGRKQFCHFLLVGFLLRHFYFYFFFSRSLHTLPGTLKWFPSYFFLKLSPFLCLPASLDPITLGFIHVRWSHRFQIFVSVSLSSSHSHTHTHTEKIHAQTHTRRAYQAGVLNINILLIWQLGMMWFDVCVHVCVICTHHF